METHKRVLGILYIVTGVFQILLLSFLSTLLSTLFPMLIERAGEGAWALQWVSSLGGTIAFALIVVFAIPSLIAGVGILNNKSWALVLALILGCFKLFSFPIGTIIGIYTIWVFSEHQKLTKTKESV
jgi:hypothetical protein